MAVLYGVVAVVNRARGDQPYVVATPRRIYRMVSAREVVAVPYWEARLVEELLQVNELVTGRRLELRCDEVTRAVSVLELSQREPGADDWRLRRDWREH
ncbi:hypothetical protein ACQPW3_39585 [Actinosynnema sp. CA-248983]